MDWHLKNTEPVLRELASSTQGLASAEAARRLIKFGKNEIEAKEKKHLFSMILDQFKDIFIIILIAAAVIAGFVGDPVESLAIVAIVILNALIGITQEYRAEKTLEALRTMAAPEAVVIRDGHPAGIPARELVPGDIVLLEAGKIVPADLRLTESASLKADESSLTGESLPVDKCTQALTEKDIPLGDRRNMAYSGTSITYGRGSGVVVATGMQTELGSIAHMLQDETDVHTPLQHRLEAFSRRLALAIFMIVAIIFAAGLMRGEPLVLMFLTAVSLAVAAIPEALPAVVTISLALGARKMARQQALIRKLPAVETLGSVTYICSDKTGTLTVNNMTVEAVWCNGRQLAPDMLVAGIAPSDPLHLMLHAMALSNDAFTDKAGALQGDPTEQALYACARHAGIDKKTLSPLFPRLAELPFDSERKLMTTLHRWKDGGCISFTKGAAETILARSSAMHTAQGPSSVDRDALRQLNNTLADQGLRVLGIAMRTWDTLPDAVSPETVEQELVLLGLVGMIDPPREEAGKAVALCKTAGITPVMITGDHPVTAQAIARRLGIMSAADRALGGAELARMQPEELASQVEHVRVYARVAPEQKLKIVKALQSRNHFVAMTGDGINDAPALDKANIGVSMGITGTDVAKEASDMILLDDNFATLVNAVREGRRIYDNILKFITYSLTSNAGTLWLIFLAPFLGLPLPLLPIQILWMNLLCDSLPGLALAAEPADARIMQRSPRPMHEGVFAGGRGYLMLLGGLSIGALFLVFQTIGIHKALPWQTMLFTGLVLGRMAVAVAVRTEHDVLPHRGLLKNKFLLAAIGITFALQMAVVYIPALNPIFKTEPLQAGTLCATFAAAAAGLVLVEGIKFLRKRIKG